MSYIEWLTLAIPTRQENIIGAIHGMPYFGPRLVQANPKSPMVSKGATVIWSIRYCVREWWAKRTNKTIATITLLQGTHYPDPFVASFGNDVLMEDMRNRTIYIRLVIFSLSVSWHPGIDRSHSRNKGQADSNSSKSPLLIHWLEGL
jgi:hypothetical protein